MKLEGSLVDCNRRHAASVKGRGRLAQPPGSEELPGTRGTVRGK